MPEIKLYRGEIALVSECDYEWLSAMRWHKSIRGYAQRSPKPGVTEFMHRLIMGTPPEGMQVDHINGNKLDNRRENLRFVSASENCVNRYWDRPYRGTSQKNGQWQASFRGKYLGLFPTRELAAQAVQDAVAAFRR